MHILYVYAWLGVVGSNNIYLPKFMIQQIEITLKPKSRGFHLVTSEILSQLPKLPKTGIINIFTKHTSCGLSINENCDPDVRVDMETIFNRLVPENQPYYGGFR